MSEPRAASWWKLTHEHHDDAAVHLNRARTARALGPLAYVSIGVDLAVAMVGALLALVNVQRGQLQELRRIRKVLERGHITGIGLSARPTPKEGSQS